MVIFLDVKKILLDKREKEIMFKLKSAVTEKFNFVRTCLGQGEIFKAQNCSVVFLLILILFGKIVVVRFIEPANEPLPERKEIRSKDSIETTRIRRRQAKF